jgi:hypothetical protein
MQEDPDLPSLLNLSKWKNTISVRQSNTPDCIPLHALATGVRRRSRSENQPIESPLTGPDCPDVQWDNSNLKTILEEAP